MSDGAAERFYGQSSGDFASLLEQWSGQRLRHGSYTSVLLMVACGSEPRGMTRVWRCWWRQAGAALLERKLRGKCRVGHRDEADVGVMGQ